ncbi:glutathione S-transferase, partial [Gammaproteobacteria bacterium]|nr:glutathione S-transferase [Gammaproteobacteria bacterium]
LMNDLSGLDLYKNSLNALEDCPDSLKQILSQVGKYYVPVLLANAKAIEYGNESWEAEVDGSVWKQKSFPYQTKCLRWIQDEFNSLNNVDKKRVLDFLDGTGCENLF